MAPDPETRIGATNHSSRVAGARKRVRPPVVGSKWPGAASVVVLLGVGLAPSRRPWASLRLAGSEGAELWASRARRCDAAGCGAPGRGVRSRCASLGLAAGALVLGLIRSTCSPWRATRCPGRGEPPRGDERGRDGRDTSRSSIMAAMRKVPPQGHRRGSRDSTLFISAAHERRCGRGGARGRSCVSGGGLVEYQGPVGGMGRDDAEGPDRDDSGGGTSAASRARRANGVYSIATVPRLHVRFSCPRRDGAAAPANPAALTSPSRAPRTTGRPTKRSLRQRALTMQRPRSTRRGPGPRTKRPPSR